jgi:hypothetical protein
MLGKIAAKRALKRAANTAALLLAPFAARAACRQACVFVYHRIADVSFVDPVVDDRNVPPRLFEAQIAALAKLTELVPLQDLPTRLAAGSATGKPLVCITFDDGYANFCTHALPILKRYNAPATVFVVTSLIGHGDPPPFDAWSCKNRGRVP